MKSKRTTAVLCVLSAMVATGFGECEVHETRCAEGETKWQCLIQPTPCNMADVVFPCAGNVQDAIVKANQIALERRKPVDPIVGTTCKDTGSKVRAQPQNNPPASCDGSTASNACVACAMDSCCDEYQTCLEDATCTCWVYCLAVGGSMDVCAQADKCGPFNAVTASAEACLDLYCPAECTGSTCDE